MDVDGRVAAMCGGCMSLSLWHHSHPPNPGRA